MKFDIIEFASNYNLFYSITGSLYGAVGMYMFTVFLIFIIAFSINGLTVGKLPSFKGKEKLMGITLAILTAVLAELFYSFLDFFKTPLTWLYKYWWIVLIVIIFILIIFSVISIIIENKKEKIQKISKN